MEKSTKSFSLLKFEYGEELKWLLPYPGDWHMLKNFQIACALMKPYFDAGLKSLAQAAGYPLAAIQSCGQFKRTHNFLLEAWESVYRAMLALFLESHNSTPNCEVQLFFQATYNSILLSQYTHCHQKIFPKPTHNHNKKLSRF